mmetsp:Transcript_23570/g.75629  ORF Transcript_23570/g.75629 Transcript_23570/m.75629 type:complete len:218 (+) Transcript_23570:1287-1940(+)
MLFSVCVGVVVASAGAFVVPSSPASSQSSTSLKAFESYDDVRKVLPSLPPYDELLPGMPGKSIEVGGKVFDPLELAQWRDIGTLRESELKHGRVAMLAWVGWLFPQTIGTFPVDYVKTTDPVEAIAAVPMNVWAQLLVLGGVFECARYNWDNGLFVFPFEDPEVFFDPAKVCPKDQKDFDVMMTKELKNGRMAMIAWTGLVVHHFIPDAVPLLGSLK